MRVAYGPRYGEGERGGEEKEKEGEEAGAGGGHRDGGGWGPIWAAMRSGPKWTVFTLH